MAAQFRISAKNLGNFNLPDACPRCLWIGLHYEGKLPFQIFPGIFSSIDSYTKKAVHGWWDEHGAPPPWLELPGEIREYKKVPGHARFQVLDEETDILLTGVPDDIFVRADGAHLIVDYKTARFTEGQDGMLPVYHAQLNGYAHIAERTGYAPVGGLALIYMEPQTGQTEADHPANRRADGFALPFAARIVPVERQPDLVPALLARARALYDERKAPASREGCADCAALDQLVEFANRLSST